MKILLCMHALGTACADLAKNKRNEWDTMKLLNLQRICRFGKTWRSIRKADPGISFVIIQW